MDSDSLLYSTPLSRNGRGVLFCVVMDRKTQKKKGEFHDMVRMLRNILRTPLKTMFLEVGVWGESPHIALLLFAEKQKGRFLEMSLIINQEVLL